jgi:hypothetical protein
MHRSGHGRPVLDVLIDSVKIDPKNRRRKHDQKIGSRGDNCHFTTGFHSVHVTTGLHSRSAVTMRRLSFGFHRSSCSRREGMLNRSGIEPSGSVGGREPPASRSRHPSTENAAGCGTLQPRSAQRRRRFQGAHVSPVRQFVAHGSLRDPDPAKRALDLALPPPPTAAPRSCRASTSGVEFAARTSLAKPRRPLRACALAVRGSRRCPPTLRSRYRAAATGFPPTPSGSPHRACHGPTLK